MVARQPQDLSQNSVKTAKRELAWLRGAKNRLAGRKRNVGKTERLVTAGLGAAALLFGVRKGKSPVGVALTALGTALLARGAAGYCPLYEAMGVNRRPAEYDKKSRDQSRGNGADVVEEASRESFPASDPPGWIDSES